MKIAHFLPLLGLLLTATFLPAQDPDIQDEYSGEGMGNIFRTSDQAGENPTSARKRKQQTKRVSVPDGAFRVGCICMDDIKRDTRSTGACSGHGGVRYWLYRTREGDTVRVLTGNHERHPKPLDAAELSQMAKTREKKTQNLTSAKNANLPAPVPVTILTAPAAPENGLPDWAWPLSVAAASFFLYLTVRFSLGWVQTNESLVRDALSHLLRHRKRPAARKNRKTPDQKRLQ